MCSCVPTNAKSLVLHNLHPRQPKVPRSKGNDEFLTVVGVGVGVVAVAVSYLFYANYCGAPGVARGHLLVVPKKWWDDCQYPNLEGKIYHNWTPAMLALFSLPRTRTVVGLGSAVV